MKQAILDNLMEIMKVVSEINSDDLSVVIDTVSTYHEQTITVRMNSSIENKTEKIFLYESNRVKFGMIIPGREGLMAVDYYNPKKDQIGKLVRSVWDGVCPFLSYRYGMNDILTDSEKSHIANIISYSDPDIGTKEYWTESIAIGDRKYTISPVNTLGFYVHGSTGEYIANDLVDLLKILTDDTKNFDQPKMNESREE